MLTPLAIEYLNRIGAKIPDSLLVKEKKFKDCSSFERMSIRTTLSIFSDSINRYVESYKDALDIDMFQSYVDNLLDLFHKRKAFYSSYYDKDSNTVYIKPMKAIESIKLNFTITRS